MTSDDLVSLVAGSTGLRDADARRLLLSMFLRFREAIRDGEPIAIDDLTGAQLIIARGTPRYGELSAAEAERRWREDQGGGQHQQQQQQQQWEGDDAAPSFGHGGGTGVDD